jgi:hypothetical protein
MAFTIYLNKITGEEADTAKEDAMKFFPASKVTKEGMVASLPMMQTHYLMTGIILILRESCMTTLIIFSCLYVSSRGSWHWLRATNADLISSRRVL